MWPKFLCVGVRYSQWWHALRHTWKSLMWWLVHSTAQVYTSFTWSMEISWHLPGCLKFADDVFLNNFVLLQSCMAWTLADIALFNTLMMTLVGSTKSCILHYGKSSSPIDMLSTVKYENLLTNTKFTCDHCRWAETMNIVMQYTLVVHVRSWQLPIGPVGIHQNLKQQSLAGCLMDQIMIVSFYIFYLNTNCW